LKKDVPSTDKDSTTQSLPVYEGTESVSGKVDISIPSGKKVDHLGIKIEMLGFVGEFIYHNVHDMPLVDTLGKMLLEDAIS
jgi:hypothetical protein